jgi:hypothetical protein
MKKTKKKPEKPPVKLFVMLCDDMTTTPAWLASSCSARIYYLYLKSLLNRAKPEENNGEVFISQRDAAKAIGVTRSVIQRVHLEVIHFGFVVETSPGRMGTDGRGRAPHLRLTELPTKDGAATKDYLNWDGTPFTPPKWRRPRKSYGLENSPPRTGKQSIRMA